MKNNIDSHFAIAILALVAACVGFAFWLSEGVDDVSQDSGITIIDEVGKVNIGGEVLGPGMLFYHPMSRSVSDDRNVRDLTPIIYIDQDGESERIIAKLKNSQGRWMSYYNGGTYYLSSGDIELFDIKNQESKPLQLKGEGFENRVSSFIMKDDQIIYMTGNCSEASQCQIYKKSVDSNSVQDIVADVHEIIPLGNHLQGGLELHGYNQSGVVQVLQRGGSHGVLFAKLYEIGMDDRSLTEIQTFRHSDCDFLAEYSEPCTEANESENVVYTDFFRDKRVCDNGLKLSEGMRLVGCVE